VDGAQLPLFAQRRAIHTNEMPKEALIITTSP
jgi:hypothetical protein